MIVILLGLIFLFAIVFGGLLVSGAVGLNHSPYRCTKQETRFVQWVEYRELGNLKLNWPVLEYHCDRYTDTRTGDKLETLPDEER